jgi:hypothetical protein
MKLEEQHFGKVLIKKDFAKTANEEPFLEVKKSSLAENLNKKIELILFSMIIE